MFKLVVLCSVLAGALATPQFWGTGYAPASPYIATGYAPVASGVISAAPILPAATLAYGGPTHFIKKREALLPPAYLDSTLGSPKHLVEKRQAFLPLASTSYIAPATYGSPVLASTYSAAAPLYAPISPLGVTHLIKKRSPQAFLAPAAVAPLAAAPLLSTYTSGAALAYPAPIAYPALPATSYLWKK